MPIFAHDEKTVLVETARHKDTFGNLFLTNKRLIFEHASGIFTKRVYVTLDLPLEGIANVTVEGTIAKRLAIYAGKGFVSSFPLRLDFSVKEPLLWQDRLVSALKLRAESLDAEKKRERIQVILDFGALKEYMVKGGLALQTMKCPECGAPLKLPQSGSQIRCEHCGNTVFAQDVFEKIRSLI